MMRRSPRQARGHQRVAQLLDTAEALFGEVGFEAATTNQIAARANVSIGSLYQFFPNKAAIVSAVAARYQEAAGEAIDTALGSAAAALPPAELAGRLLDAMVAYGMAHMGFTRMVLQAGASHHLAGVASTLMDMAAARLEAVLAARQPALTADERPMAARVAMTTVMALLALATSEKARGSVYVDAIIAEARQLLCAYLAVIDARAASA
ncbi:MAG: TetR/AcrR family transcriptional regulator [Roseiflexaceae bacterium]|nr:TetR/AcrR family transcriptional regulator [Roseiflexaceae bacterium]